MILKKVMKLKKIAKFDKAVKDLEKKKYERFKTFSYICVVSAIFKNRRPVLIMFRKPK